jgi:hypothetical protein
MNPRRALPGAAFFIRMTVIGMDSAPNDESTKNFQVLAPRLFIRVIPR